MKSNDLFSEEECSFPINEPLQASQSEQMPVEANEEIGQRHGEPFIQIKYYQQFKKIYYTSYKLWTELHRQIETKNQLTAKIHTIEVNTQLTTLHKTRRHEEVEEAQDDEEMSSKHRRAKRARRTTEQIQRKYYCIAKFCDRSYGSQGSLQQHLKLKHPQLSKRVGTRQQEY